MTAAKTLPLRREIPVEETWDLSPLYASADAWEADFASLDSLLPPILAFQGKLDSPEAAAAAFAAEEVLDRALEKLFTYAHLSHDVDTASGEELARFSRIQSRYAELAAACAWLTPELVSKGGETLASWAAAPALAPFARRMEKLRRAAGHVLSKECETLLASAGEVLSASGEIYSLLTDADLSFGEVEDAKGEKHLLSEGTYRVLLASPDRTLRGHAFHALLGVYEAHRNTLAALLATTVKEHVFTARARKYKSARAAALFDDAVPESVYDALISAVRGSLGDFARYLELRRRALGLETLDMFDLYVPPAPEEDRFIPRAEAEETVLEAIGPLGADYLAAAKEAFSSRWIDWRENKGKRTGAYSSGCYGSPPYLLLNYQGHLDDVFTLAHELGHSLHTKLANAAQPHQTAGYPIFLAEIASTTNEILLSRHLLATLPRGPRRTLVLQHFLDSFKGTLFRQTMFAEFERDLHAMAEAGEALTADELCERYGQLNRAYYPAIASPDEAIRHEWARIPHFHYDFYVYKYATSFAAALVFSERILAGESPAGYLALLAKGGSEDPLDALAAAGVDMTDPGVVSGALGRFRKLLDELEADLAGS
mgnify:FL=1